MSLKLYFHMVLSALAFVVLLTACNGGKSADDPNDCYNNSYLDIDYRTVIAANRLCAEMKYTCLPGSRDPSAQAVLQATNINSIRGLPKVEKDGVYQLSPIEYDLIRERERRVMYKEITQMLDLYFPGFWGDMEMERRLKWIGLVETKVGQYLPSYGRGEVEDMAIICAMLDLDFESKPQYLPIARYLATMQQGHHGQLSQTKDYLYFVFLKRDFNDFGGHLNNWSLRDALACLPSPKRHVPSFDTEVPDGKMYHPEYDILNVYFRTIREGGGKGRPGHEDENP